MPKLLTYFSTYEFFSQYIVNDFEQESNAPYSIFSQYTYIVTRLPETINGRFSFRQPCILAIYFVQIDIPSPHGHFAGNCRMPLPL